MKTLFSSRVLTYALIVALPLWLGSCKKGDDNVTPTTTSIEGSWKINSYTINPGIDLGGGKNQTDLLSYYRDVFAALDPTAGDKLVNCLKSTVVTFNAGGKITSKQDASCASTGVDQPISDDSAWKLDGNKLTITDGSDVTAYDVIQTGNTLQLSTQETLDFTGSGQKQNYTVTLGLTKI